MSPIFHLMGPFILLIPLWSCTMKGGTLPAPNRGLVPDATPTAAPTATATPATGDPYYTYQWHLYNTAQVGGSSVAGEDINVRSVWGTNKGEGVRVAVVDDGLQIAHPDLAANIWAGFSFNYSDSTSDPTSLTSGHGTSAAGLISARDDNGIGVRGVASRASLVGYNLLAGLNFTSANQADAMTRNAVNIDVSSNSWGFEDETGEFKAGDSTWEAGLETGLSTGRAGKGTVYVYAAGNGKDVELANYDGYTLHHGAMAICAVGDDGKRAWYSEKGAHLWVCAPSMGNDYKGMTTTDLTGNYGYNKTSTPSDYAEKDYTAFFNGTSAATPVAAGVAALVLKANPSLTWRDVKAVIMESARQNDPTDLSWAVNGAGYNISDKYGFGVLDANAAVTLAAGWSLLDPQVIYDTPVQASGSTINANGGATVTSTMTVAGSGVSAIEYMYVTVNLTHTDWGVLEISLTRAGYATQSYLATQHQCLSGSTHVNCSVAGNTFRFSVVRNYGEPANGNWTLSVRNAEAGSVLTGTLTSWKIKFFGH